MRKVNYDVFITALTKLAKVALTLSAVSVTSECDSFCVDIHVAFVIRFIRIYMAVFYTS